MLLPTDASACTCSGSTQPPPQAELARQVRSELSDALAVFLGVPIASNALTVRLHVLAVWKGELGTEVVMATGAEATSDGAIRQSTCDASFAFGETYLIFASGKTTETMKARNCSFTSPLRYTAVPKTLDGILQRRQPSALIAPRRLLAVIGLVKNPGLLEWHAGMTVADAIKGAGGTVQPTNPLFGRFQFKSKIIRTRATREEHAALPAVILVPDDELFVGVDLPDRRPDRHGGPMIRKLSDGRYRLYSRKKNPSTGKRRNLGTFATRAAAMKHERAVQFFKRGG